MSQVNSDLLHLTVNDARVGSYGTIFVPESKKPNSDLLKYYENLLNEEIISNIKKSSASVNKRAKQYGKLYATGINSKNVLSSVSRDLSVGSEILSSPFLHNTSDRYNEKSNVIKSKFQLTKYKKPLLRTSEAILLDDKRKGGRYHVPCNISEPYQEMMESKVNISSMHTSTTPSSWPDSTMYTNSINKTKLIKKTTKMASIKTNKKSNVLINSNLTNQMTDSYGTTENVSFDVISRLAAAEASYLQPLKSKQTSKMINDSTYNSTNFSTLQRSLIEDGLLKSEIAPTPLPDEKASARIDLSLEYGKKLIRQHSEWLSRSGVSTAEATATSSTNKHWSSGGLGPSKSQSSNLVPGPELHKRYSEMLLEHLDSASPALNPYRGVSCSGSTRRSKLLQAKAHLPSAGAAAGGGGKTDYTDHTYRRQTVTYAICVKHPVPRHGADTGTGAPSRAEVQDVFSTILRRTAIRYDLRLVELGVAVKALLDPRHPSPGVRAVTELHHCFTAAAALNPTVWILTREQMGHILAQKLPWYPANALRRLLSCFDPGCSNRIRFVQLTASLMAAVRPAMNELIGRLNRVTASLRKDGSGGASDGELLLLRLIHGLYDTCGGMSLEHVTESVSLCAASAGDEQRMQAVIAPILEKMRTWSTGRTGDLCGATTAKSSGPPDAPSDCNSIAVSTASFLKHPLLRSLTQAPAVISIDSYISCLNEDSEFVAEFSQQLSRYRNGVNCS